MAGHPDGTRTEGRTDRAPHHCCCEDLHRATQFAQVGATSQSQKDFDEAYREWQHEKAILNALLRAYFQSEDLDRHWLQCRALATAYYVQTGIFDDERRQRYLEMVAAGLQRQPEPVDSSEEVPQDLDSASHLQQTEALDLRGVHMLRAEIQRQFDEAVRTALDVKVSIPT